MAASRPDIAIPKGVWTDVYNLTGIAVGTAIDIFNKGNYECVVASKSTIPMDTTTLGVPLYTGKDGYLHVTAGEPGIWVYSPDGIAHILVQD